MTIPRIDSPRTARETRVALLLLLLVLGAASAPTRAVSADPLQSDGCRQAIETMQAAEASEAIRHSNDAASRSALPTPSPALQGARRDAAKRCLASRLDVEPERGRFAQTPIVVDPVAAPAASRTAAPSSGHLPATTTRRPDAVASCDAGGCWANDGSRLQRVGPVLWGPRGACTTQGASLQCP